MFKSPIRTEYDRLASVYDWLWQRYLACTGAFLYQWTQLARENVVVDVACGTGLFAEQVLRAFPQQHIIGLDLSAAMLKVAARRCASYPHVALHVATATALPLAATRFDVALCASALHYFDDPHGALVEIKRVLKPDGRVVILDWCRDFLGMQVLDRVLKRLDPAHTQTYTESELQQLLAAAGFTMVHAKRQRCGLFWGLMVATARPVR
jgi:ubiquinone/menaquinone biosynthesis C-methylase UbiE